VIDSVASHALPSQITVKYREKYGRADNTLYISRVQGDADLGSLPGESITKMYDLACDQHDLVEQLIAKNTEITLRANASIAERDEHLEEVS